MSLESVTNMTGVLPKSGDDPNFPTKVKGSSVIFQSRGAFCKFITLKGFLTIANRLECITISAELTGCWHKFA